MTEVLVHTSITARVERYYHILGRAYLGLFHDPHTQTMHPTVTISTVHQTKGLTCRHAAILRRCHGMSFCSRTQRLSKPTRNLPGNSRTRRKRNTPLYQRLYPQAPPPRTAVYTSEENHTAAPCYGQDGTSAGATGMDVDQYLKGQGTPPGTFFNDGFTPSTTRGHTTADLPHRERP